MVTRSGMPEQSNGRPLARGVAVADVLDVAGHPYGLDRRAGGTRAIKPRLL